MRTDLFIRPKCRDVVYLPTNIPVTAPLSPSIIGMIDSIDGVIRLFPIYRVPPANTPISEEA